MFKMSQAMAPTRSQRVRFIDDYHKLCDARTAASAGILLDASAVLRRWFLDSPALAHTINKKYRFKLKFCAVVPEQIEPSELYVLSMAGDSIDPDGPPELEPVISELNLDAFLKLPVVQYSKSNYVGCVTVKDVILFLANSAGGVHTETYESGNRLEAALEEISLHALFYNGLSTIQGEHVGLLLRSLRPISRIVANATQKLYEALVEEDGIPESLKT